MDLSERGSSTTRHPWEQARARFFARVLADYRAIRGRVLDVGAGDGFFAAHVRDRGARDVSLWDLHYGADDIANLSRAGFAATTTRPTGPFDLVMLLDVIEHVADDRAFLSEVLDVTAADASVLVSVPAWPALWSSHDVALSHVKRYRPREMRALLEDAGLRVVEDGGVFHSLMAPRALSVLRERTRALVGRNGHPAESGVGGFRGGALLAGAIASVLETEGKLSRALSTRGVRAPGLSYWAFARRR